MTAWALDRKEIGKTYWKSVALPSSSYRGNIVVWRVGELNQLQIAENEVSEG